MDTDKAAVKAQHALIDPLHEPDPSEETGLNSHFGSTFAPRQQLPTPPGSAEPQITSFNKVRHEKTGSSVETNPYRRSRGTSLSQSASLQHGESPRTGRYSLPSPPGSASPRRDHFPDYRKEAFASSSQGRPRRASQPVPPANHPQKASGLARSGSLRERYPGDMSHRPLDQLTQDTKSAYRAHHLRKKNFQGADVIDRLDKSTWSYHHEGPYDAASLARNMSFTHSPVAAVADSNEEALKATPRENIINSVERHRPLEGTAVVPPGMPDRFGRVLHYQEGADLMREPGADYKRWPGVEYHPDDLKGKGEPYFTIDKALKDHKELGESGVEMETRNRAVSHGSADASAVSEGHASGLGRSPSTSKAMGNVLKKRFGSLRRRKVST